MEIQLFFLLFFTFLKPKLFNLFLLGTQEHKHGAMRWSGEVVAGSQGNKGGADAGRKKEERGHRSCGQDQGARQKVGKGRPSGFGDQL